ncbi:MAG: tetratricopeptide repeat protein, partial [Spirochaetota bacterium]|nr:tetratricopeptide repeat protein [Spirochaetota bacterium]
KESKYKELIKFWDNKVLMNGKKDFSLKDYLQYNIVFYYIAESYQKTEAYKEAVKYYDIFAELTRSPDNLIKIYFNRSISLLELKSELDRAIFDLKEALRLVENRPDKDSKWNIRILWTLGLTYKVISTDVSEAKKRYYTKRLGISNFLEETINYFKKGADLSLQSDDIPFWIKFQTEIGDIYRAQKKYQNAIQVYEYLASMLQSQLERTEDDYITIMVAYNDIGGCYSLMDRVLLAESNYQKALKLNEEYSQYITNPKRKIYEALFNQNLGSLYYRLKWYERSLQPLKKAYEIAKELNLPQLGIYEKKYKDVQKKLK